MKRLATALCLFALPFAAGAPAETPAHTPRDGSKNVKAALFCEHETVRPGLNTRLAVRLKVKKGWHIYWLNPGDSGKPTSVVFSAPEGWRIGAVRYPAPQRLSEQGITSFFWDNEVWVTADLSVPESAVIGKNVRVSAKIDWLECETMCVPGDAEVRATLAVAKKERLGDNTSKSLENAARLFPAASPLWKVKAVRKGDAVAISLRSIDPRLPDGSEVVFFPLDRDLFANSNSVKISGPGRIDVLQPLAQRGNTPPVLRGVITSSKGWGIPEGRQALSIEAEIEGPSQGASPSVWMAILWAFLGGLILNLMPCVFPVLSIKILGFVRHSGGDRALVRKQGLFYFAGVVLSFLAVAGLLLSLKAGGQALGWGFQLQNPIFILAMTALVFLIGLNLAGVFEIGTPAVSMGAGLSKPGVGASFLSGVLAVVIASPCTAPFMGAALGYALAQPWYLALLVFLFLGLGMGAPYLLLSFNHGLLARLPKPGDWMVTFKQAMAFPMFATALWLAWVFGNQAGVDGMLRLLGMLLLLALAAWALGRWALPHRGAALRFSTRAGALALAALAFYVGYTGARFKAPVELSVRSAGTARWEAWSPERVRGLESAGKPYFVDFTAAWCLTCQVNKKTALGTRAVEKAFRDRGVTLLRADWTDYNPAITKALASVGRAGVPVYLWHPGRTGERQVLPELLTEKTVLDAMTESEAKK